MLDTNKNTNCEIYEFKELGASNVIYSGSNGVYFIGTVDDGTDYHKRDIYHLDLETKSLTQITTDGNHKDHLDIYLRKFKKVD